MFAPQINPFESIMFGKGGEIKPPFVSTMPYFGGGKMETIGPYIPDDDDSKVVPLSPLGGYLGSLMASHDKPFSRYPAAGGSDRWPGLPPDKLDYLHPAKDPLTNIRITPFGMKAESMPFAGDLFSA